MKIGFPLLVHFDSWSLGNNWELFQIFHLHRHVESLGVHSNHSWNDLFFTILSKFILPKVRETRGWSWSMVQVRIFHIFEYFRGRLDLSRGPWLESDIISSHFSMINHSWNGVLSIVLIELQILSLLIGKEGDTSLLSNRALLDIETQFFLWHYLNISEIKL